MSPVLAQMWVRPVLAQMWVSPVPVQMWVSPVPVQMCAGKTPVVAKMSGRGEPAAGWVESLAQLPMHMSTAQTQIGAAGRDRGRLTGVRGREGCVCVCVCV